MKGHLSLKHYFVRQQLFSSIINLFCTGTNLSYEDTLNTSNNRQIQTIMAQYWCNKTGLPSSHEWFYITNKHDLKLKRQKHQTPNIITDALQYRMQCYSSDIDTVKGKSVLRKATWFERPLFQEPRGGLSKQVPKYIYLQYNTVAHKDKGKDLNAIDVQNVWSKILFAAQS